MKKIITVMLSLIMMMTMTVTATAMEVTTENVNGGHEHTWSAWTVVTDATCTGTGVEERHCTDINCPDPDTGTETRTIPALGHDWGGWTLIHPATIFSQGVDVQTCSRCGIQNTRNTAALAPYVTWTHKVSKLPRKSSETFSVSLANGDYVTKWKSSKKKIASVNQNGVVKGKKKGKTKITAYTASGLKISCTVKVVKPKKKSKKKAQAQSSAFTGIVYWTPSGAVYHSTANCPTLARSRTINSGTIEQSGKGSACNVCF